MDPKPARAPRKPRGKRAELAAWIEREQPRRIGEEHWNELQRELGPLSESYLRHLLRGCAVPLAPLIAGVRQESLDSLESSLLALVEEYERGDAARRSKIRRLVIEAKDHARWASRKGGGKEEMMLWMLTWLENPPLFPGWVRLRRSVISEP